MLHDSNNHTNGRHTQSKDKADQSVKQRAFGFHD
jgi:hypothetical protein